MHTSPERELTQESPAKERSVAFYNRALREHLDPKIFRPNPKRLIGFALCMGVASALILFTVLANPAWYFKVLAGLGIGFCTGTLGFLCHEALHGSIVRNHKAQDALFFFGIIPFFISPTYWRHSHNRLHHGNAQKLGIDPDAFPNTRLFKASKYMQFMYPFTPGSGHKRSIFYFFYWFSLHNLVAQVYMRFHHRGFDDMNHRRATIELSLQVLIGIAYLALIGPSNWLPLFVLPFVIQNYMLMSYISTNHNISPLTSVNDPLANSLSVKVHPVLEFLNINFGYHVEHHLFPTMCASHAKTVHKELVRQFPNDYKIMPKWKAIKLLYSTPRVYKNAHTLIHPHTGETFPTL